MKNINVFSSENFMMSLGGHLLLVAIMMTSFALVVDRAKLVAPDRIQITEIDLNMVRVSGDETRLYDVGTLDDKSDKKDAPAPAKNPEPAPAPTPVDTAAMIDTPAPPTAKSDATAKPDTPAPKKQTVVRVNRQVVSMDRTLTVSVRDALRVAMTRCWTIDTRRPDIADIRAVAHLKMNRNGMVRDVWFESAARAESDPAFAYVLDTIRAAISVCQPFKMLPASEFEKWEDIQLTFYPTNGAVM